MIKTITSISIDPITNPIGDVIITEGRLGFFDSSYLIVPNPKDFTVGQEIEIKTKVVGELPMHD